MLLDVVYNHVGASGTKAPEGVRPLLHLALRDAVGRGDQLRRRALGRCARVGAAERRAVGARLPRRRAAARRRAHDQGLQPRAPRRRRRAPHRAGLRDRRIRPERPDGDARRHARRLGLRRRLGRRLPPRAAHAADRRPRGLLRRVRRARRPGQGLPPAARPRRHVLELPPPPLRRPRRRRPARALRGLLRQPRPGRQPRRSATACRWRCAPWPRWSPSSARSRR